MDALLKKTLEHLETLADAARQYWICTDVHKEKDFATEEAFEIELVRAEDFLEEMKNG